MKICVSLGSFRTAMLAALGALPSAGCAVVYVDDAGGQGDRRAAGPGLAAACEPLPPAGGEGADGFEACEGGFSHRYRREACGRAPSGACGVGNGPLPGAGGCRVDDDCDERSDGRCLFFAGGVEGCGCRYGCVRDGDCGAGQICACDESGGRCVESTCAVDADCPPGLLCASATMKGECREQTFACQSPDDACAGDDDCEGNEVCAVDGGKRACTARTGCAVPGRPFRVEGADRRAPPAARDDWSLPAAGLAPESLPPTLRAELAAPWTRARRMEHASVAAFARFALQLLALGAPPELVVGAQAAMGDELEHARLCFGLARALGGHAVGPGPLAMHGALDGVTMAEVVRLAIVEGCVGETVAAVEAAEALERAGEPAVRAVLRQIRGDETRHAELAWRFVAWALEAGDQAVRGAAADAFAEALGGDGAGPADAGERGEGAGGASEADARGLRFGRLPGRLSAELRRRALREVVGPCAERLFAAASRPPAAERRADEGAEAIG